MLVLSFAIPCKYYKFLLKYWLAKIPQTITSITIDHSSPIKNTWSERPTCGRTVCTYLRCSANRTSWHVKHHQSAVLFTAGKLAHDLNHHVPFKRHIKTSFPKESSGIYFLTTVKKKFHSIEFWHHFPLSCIRGRKVTLYFAMSSLLFPDQFPAKQMTFLKSSFVE